MPETVYLTVDEVVVLHDLILKRMGSPHAPLTRPDRLDAAVNRPRQLTHYEPGAHLITQAALLAVAISQAQAFAEGTSGRCSSPRTRSLP